MADSLLSRLGRPLAGLGRLFAGSPVIVRKVAMYQPPEQVAKRMGSDASRLTEYTKQVQSIVIAAVRHRSAEEFAFIVAWDQSRAFVFADAKEAEVKADLLSAETKVRAVTLPKVSGPVMFALVMAQGDALSRYRPLPTPPEWAQMANRQKRPLPVPDMLFAI